MTPGAPTVTEPDPLAPWRRRALNILLVLFSLIMLPAVLSLMNGTAIRLPAPVRLTCYLLYGLMLLATVLTRLAFRWRAALLFVCVALAGLIQMLASQLLGSGRISLLLLPLLALVLAGPRTGWLLAGLSTVLFAGTAIMDMTGVNHAWLILPGSGGTPGFWALQGVVWLASLLALMILFTRFQALQKRTAQSERVALDNWKVETASRRRLEEEINRMGEEERRRLGSELHDGLCQHLTGTLLSASALENDVRHADPPLTAKLTRIRESLEQAIDLAYRVARGLSPVTMDPASLVPALEHLCQDTRDAQALDCRLRADADPGLRDAEHALHLYRIAREAVANAVRHAGASVLAIDLGREPGGLVLTVTDNGRWKPAGPGERPGMGLHIMSHRAHRMGGTLEIGAAPDGGTRVICRIPEKGTRS